MFGISQNSFELLLKTIAEFDEVRKAAIYGSRAMGNYKKGSDIDLVLFGELITQDIILKIKVKLEHVLPIPYFFDITHYESISNAELKLHIDQFGKIIYTVN